MSSSDWKIPLSDVDGDEDLVAAATDAIASGWWSSGPRVAELEDRFASFTGSRHAIALSNGTAALHLALLAVGVGPDDEVITPALTFVAVANMVRHTGGVPVFCDVLGPTDLNLDPVDLERSITSRTRAIVALHYGGFSCDIEAIADLAEKRGIALIEDAAHAVGATVGGRACGTFGSVGCFSFFSNKNLPIGEGGMAITDDDALDSQLRLLRSHGMTSMTWDRHRGHASTYDVVTPGFNYRLDEIRAAMALVQLERLAATNSARALHADEYVRRLHGVSGLQIAFATRDDREEAAHHLAVAVLPAGTDRDDVRARMTADGVQTSVHYPPIHTFTAYRETDARLLPRTDELADRILTLPLYPTLSNRQLDLVVSSLLSSVQASLPAGARPA